MVNGTDDMRLYVVSFWQHLVVDNPIIYIA